MVAVIREADGEPASVLAKRHGISKQTIYTWRKRFGAFQANDIRGPEVLRPRMRG
jgi:putative transposase